jgi:hypothetical protein
VKLTVGGLVPVVSVEVGEGGEASQLDLGGEPEELVAVVVEDAQCGSCASLASDHGKLEAPIFVDVTPSRSIHGTAKLVGDGE